MTHEEKDLLHHLAWKHITRHRNDKSGSIKAKMVRRFGKAQTTKAISAMEQTATMLDTPHVSEPHARLTKTQLFNKMMGKSKVFELGMSVQRDVANTIYGREVTLSIIDELDHKPCDHIHDDLRDVYALMHARKMKRDKA